ncbi:uncharacterized protein [Asterias amurensis]|uniref:uncharacterized protein n=1 Tax=Asterias amurensis TaxID=7602 RepID=UPI003AB34E2C
MPAPPSSVMLDVDTILGIHRPTKKPSSLKKPRQPPPPKYINKERALAIAKKFKISQIGKVSVRAGRNGGDDIPKVSLQSEKVLTRRILLDREKGLETARNTKDSAVGKCILGRNDYETRRLGVEFDQLNEDVERRKYQLLRRKSVFVQKRGLTLTQNGIVFDSAAPSGAVPGSHPSRRAKPLPDIQEPDRKLRDKSPSYMRPLSCDRTRSTDSQVAEVERFLASPTMQQFTKGPDEDSTLLALQTVSEANDLEAASNMAPTNSSPTRRVKQHEMKHSDLPEIAESVSSDGSELDVFHDIDDDAKKGLPNFPITKPLSRSTSVQITEAETDDVKRRHSTAYSGLRRSVGKSESDRPAGPESATVRPSSRKRSRRTSSIRSRTHSGSRPKSHGKSRSKRVSFSQKPNPTRFNVSSPSKDPRFTELTSNLIPDSAKAFDLYRSMGRLSVLDKLHKETESNVSDGLRTKMEKIGPIRPVGNIKSI